MRSRLFVLMVLVAMYAAAQGRFVKFIGRCPGGYNFILYEPDSCAGKMPLIISLHSRGASGNNLADVDMFGTIDALHSGMSLNAFVLAPQATGDRWEAEKIMKDLEWVEENYNIDTARVYAIGMSMGGNGVGELVQANPDRFAAAIMLAGTVSDCDPVALSRVPLWVIRGMKDREHAIRRTDEMVERMRSLPDKAPRLVYSRVKGLDHRQHERLLYIPEIYDWLMSHSLTNPNRSVNTTFEITPKLLKNAYKGLRLRDGSAAKRERGDDGGFPAAMGHRHR